MILRLTAVVVALAAMVATSAEAQEPTSPYESYRFEVGSQWWGTAPDLGIQTGRLVEAGVVELADEFGIDTKWGSNLRGTVKLHPRHRLSFEYLPIRLDGSAVLTREITFGNRTFTPGQALADFRWTLWRAAYEWDFLMRPAGHLGLLLSANYNDVRASVHANGRGEVAAVDAFLPAVGLRARYSPHPRVSFTPEMNLFKFTGDEVEGSLQDFDLGGIIHVTRPIGLKVGYRSVSADYLAEQDIGDFRLSGAYVGFVSRF